MPSWALARQTRGDTVEAFREAFIGRLMALATGHSLLLRSDWRSADLGRLVDDAMAAYADGGRRVQTEGPQVVVSSKQALSLSLLLHELATNALKYGALSTETDVVRIAWDESDGESGTRIRLRWKESGGPALTPPSGEGFGMQLIGQALSFELGGTAQVDWSRDGLSCEMEFPRE